jgi:hypothetical protein
MPSSSTGTRKQLNERKGNFGASLKAGDSIAIYATMPVAEILGIVRVMKRESRPISRLWQESRQGMLAKVSRQQFDTYGSEPDFRCWCLGWFCRTFAQPDCTFQTSPEFWSALATPTATSTPNPWTDRDGGTLTSPAEHREPNRALRC